MLTDAHGRWTFELKILHKISKSVTVTSRSLDGDSAE